LAETSKMERRCVFQVLAKGLIGAYSLSSP